LAAAQAHRIRAEARAAQARTVRGTSLPADMLVDSVIPKLQEQRGALMGQYRQQAQVFKPEYPAMQQLQSQIDSLDEAIASEIGSIGASMEAEYAAARAQENLLLEKIDELREKTLSVDQRSIQYTILKREADTHRQLYDAL